MEVVRRGDGLPVFLCSRSSVLGLEHRTALPVPGGDVVTVCEDGHSSPAPLPGTGGLRALPGCLQGNHSHVLGLVK